MLFSLSLFFLSQYGQMQFLYLKGRVPLHLTPFISSSLTLSILYVGAIFGFLQEFSILIFFLGAMYGLLLIVMWTRSRPNIADLFNNLWSPSPIKVYGVLFLSIWVVFQNHVLTQWDEFSFWGYFTKTLVFNNDFFGDRLDINKADYPRISALWQYYFNLVLKRGHYEDGVTIFAQVILFASAIPALLFRYKIKWRKVLVVSLVFFLLTYILVFPVYYVYNDALLGLFWAMAIVTYFETDEKPQKFFLTGLILFCIPQIKEIGILFSGFSFLAILLYELLNSKLLEIRKIIIIFGLLLALMVISKVSWKSYLHYRGVYKVSVGLDLSKVNFTNMQGYQSETLRAYFNSFKFLGRTDSIAVAARPSGTHVSTIGHLTLQGKIQAINKVFNTSFYKPGPDFLYDFKIGFSPLYWMLIFILFGSMLYLLLVNRKVPSEVFTRPRNLLFFIGILIAMFIGYAIVMLLLYLTSFVPIEATVLASYDRYLGSYLLGMFLILLYLLLRFRTRTLVITFSLLICAFAPKESIETFAPLHSDPVMKYMTEVQRKLKPFFDEVRESNPRAKVYFIDQGASGGFYVYFRYISFPCETEGWWSFHPSEQWNSDTQITTPEQLLSIIRGWDYLVVWTDTDFWENYGDAIWAADLKGVFTYSNGWIEMPK